MNYLKSIILLTLLSHHAMAQFSIGTSALSVKSGTVFSVQGLVLTPSADLSVSSNSITFSATALTQNSVSGINRVYQFATPISYSGQIGVQYSNTELNGNTEGALQIAYQSTPSGSITLVPGSNTGTSGSYFVYNSVNSVNLAAVTAMPAPSLSSVTAQVNVTCHGGNDGLAAVSVSGSIPPYSYTWSPSGGSDDTASGLAAGMYIVTITDAALSVITDTVIISQPSSAVHTWTGAVSSAWNDAANWSCGVPAGTDAVVIPSGTPFAPALNNVSFSVDSFVQNSGQTLSLGNGNLTVTGDFINNGTISGSGKVVLNGTTAQTISGTGTVSNLELNNSNGSGIGSGSNDTLKLTGLLTLTAGTFTTNGKLVLKSTASNQAAMVGPIPSSGAGITGNVIHERYLSAPGNGSGGRSWRLLTSPIAGNATNNSIFYHWQNNGVNDGTGIELFSPQGTGAAGNGLTQGGVYPSIRSYDAATNTYQNVTNTKTTNLFTGTRNNTFLTFVPGHFGSGNITSGSGITNADATGSLVVGTQTYTFTPPNATNIYYLMGNPYACPIDFDNVYNNNGTQNINRMFWVIDPNLSNIGAYVTVTYNSAGSTYITSAGNQNQYIQTGQGFFVEGNSPGNQSAVVIEENDKVTSAAQTPMFRTNGGALETFRMKLFKTISNNQTLLDGCVVAGHQSSSNALDGEDGVKFGNFNENIAIRKSNTNYAVESRQLLDHNDTVRIAITNMQQTAYQIQFEPANMNVPGLSATLIDNFTNTTTPISLAANTTYNFSVTSNSASQGTNRFAVVFNNVTPLELQFMNLRAEKKDGRVRVQWSVDKQQGMTGYDVERSGDGKSFVKIASLAVRNDGKYDSWDDQPSSGHNYYRIKAVARSGAGVYSHIVKVNMNMDNTELSTYPSPAKGSTLQVGVSNLASGHYLISIYSASGQKAATQHVSHEGGSTMISMDIESLAPGIYLMHLTDVNGERIAAQKIVKQ